MTTITFAQAYYNTTSKTVRIKLGVQTDQVPQPGSYTLTLKNGRQLTDTFEISDTSDTFEIDTQMIPQGSLQVPEITEGTFSIVVGDSYPYVIGFICRAVGFACEIESTHQQSVALTLS